MKESGILEDDVLLDRLQSRDDSIRMPPEGEPLSTEEIKAIKTWIAAGSPAPKNEQAESDPLSHWAFQKIERPSMPQSIDANPIDAYFAKVHATKNLKPQPPARRSLLIRRIYLDLIGLPPTLEQLKSKQPIEAVVDNLLKDKHHGERWGRHWMDVWRYSDWYGLGAQVRNSQKHMWHWRDWIVDSLNEDKGYDQMILEMLAADELYPDDMEAIAATGFLARNYYLFNRTTWLDDTIEHTGKAFLGLTLNCAKCHDHKYDPISHEDYYRFRSIFEPHHVRLDALAGETNYDRDGMPRVYDDKLNAETLLHKRGDPSKPDRERKIAPGPPKFLTSFFEKPTPTALPTESWAPGTRKHIQEALLAQSKQQVSHAKDNLAKRIADQQKAKTQIVKTDSNEGVNSTLKIEDDFKNFRKDLWEIIGKDWRYQGGLLAQTIATTERNGLRSHENNPRNFDLTMRFKITGGNQWKSVGIRFDVDDKGENAHTVYASAYGGGPKVQLAHKAAGKDIYPGDAKVDLPIKLNQEYSLNVKVSDTLCNISLDDKFLFAYHLPRRTEGALELFAFDAKANFFSINVEQLSDKVKLQPAKNKPTTIVSPKDLVKLANAELSLAQLEMELASAQIAADNAIGNASKFDKLKKAWGALKLKVNLASAEVELLKSDANKRAAIENKIAQTRNAIKEKKYPKHEPLRGSQRALDQGSHKHDQYAPTYPKTSTGRRTALAKWITHRDNPLTARVAVNQIWIRHFGVPLVQSTFDFGRQTRQPRHQELLDYLAVELIESGWRMKHIHRLILTSKTWQRTSSNLAADEHTISTDPENLEYWKMNSRRMESQLIRDSLLKISGKIDLEMGGPSVKPSPNVRRRSIYLFHSRDGRDKFISTFDDADIFGCYRRRESIVPQQALAMMNSREAIEATAQIAKMHGSEKSDSDFANRIFLTLLGREPEEKELAACIAYLRNEPNRTSFVHALLNHNDFQTIR